jgi:hypothetical protein
MDIKISWRSATEKKGEKVVKDLGGGKGKLAKKFWSGRYYGYEYISVVFIIVLNITLFPEDSFIHSSLFLKWTTTNIYGIIKGGEN